jgi:hypothetical protein
MVYPYSPLQNLVRWVQGSGKRLVEGARVGAKSPRSARQGTDTYSQSDRNLQL